MNDTKLHLTPFWKIKKMVSKVFESVSYEMKLKNSSENLARSGHCAVILHQGYLVMFGGYNNFKCKSDLYLLDLEELPDINIKNKYKRIDFQTSFLDTSILPRLASSSICCHPYKNIVYIFGGSEETWGMSNSDDFIIIDFDKKTHYTHNTREKGGPPPSYGTTINFWNHNLFVFGGTNGTNFFNHVYQYDLTEKTWKLMDTSGRIPKPRYKHDNFIYQDHLYILNGGQQEPFDELLELYRLNLLTCLWEKLDLQGHVPKNRIACSSAFDPENKVVWIFGGRLTNTTKSNCLYKINLDTLECNKIICENNYKIVDEYLTCSELEGREFHSCSLYKNNLICIGGSTGSVRLNSLLVFYLF